MGCLRLEHHQESGALLYIAYQKKSEQRKAGVDAYVLNNPLNYIDHSGEDPVTAVVIIGAVIGAYLGGSAANGGELNPGRWEPNLDTFAGTVFGAAIGAFAGYGAAAAGPALAGTGFFTGFANGTAAAYALTGTVAGGVLGYSAGVGGGLLYSNGDFGYAHQSGVFHGQIGAAIGSVVGAVAGKIAQSRPKPPLEVTRTQRLNHSRPNSSVNLQNGGRTELSQFVESSELYYDGQNIYWVDIYGNNTGSLEQSWPGVSGPWENGALPNGNYIGSNLRTRTTPSMVREGFGFSLNLDPTFSTARNLLRFHPDGNVPGTEGCIGLTCGYDGLSSFYNSIEIYFFRYGVTTINVTSFYYP